MDRRKSVNTHIPLTISTPQSSNFHPTKMSIRPSTFLTPSVLSSIVEPNSTPDQTAITTATKVLYDAGVFSLGDMFLVDKIMQKDGLWQSLK
jgi:hypothetical protein